jgi:hypothetical protein
MRQFMVKIYPLLVLFGLALGIVGGGAFMAYRVGKQDDIPVAAVGISDCGKFVGVIYTYPRKDVMYVDSTEIKDVDKFVAYIHTLKFQHMLGFCSKTDPTQGTTKDQLRANLTSPSELIRKF